MYWWKYKELALALKEGAISDRTYSLYKVSFAVVIFVELAFSVFFNSTSLGSAILTNLIKFSLLWIIISFINKKGDKKDTAKRFICFLTPCYLRSFALAFCIGATVGIIAGAAKASFENAPALEQWQKFGGIISSLFALIYMCYAYINGFRIASGLKAYSLNKG